MDTPHSQAGITSSFPVITLLVLGVAAAVALLPGASTWLIYDRSAILRGEIWRLFTGHWVHFSMSHLAYDALAFGMAGCMIEKQKLPNFGWICLTAPWGISGLLLLFEPHMQKFAGLSALAVTALTYLALFGLQERGFWRWACAAALLGIAGKVILEINTGRLLFATVTNEPVVACSASHLYGATFALLFFIAAISNQRRRDNHAADPIKIPRSRTARPAPRLAIARAWRRSETTARP